MLNSRRCEVVLVLALLLVAPWVAAGEELSNETCLACHGLEGFAGAEDRPLFVSAEAFADSVHGPFSCTGCHTDVGAVPHEETIKRPGPKVCAQCHGDVVAAYEQSIHGQATSNGASDAATCTSCHGPPHTMKRSTDPGSPVYQLALPRTCGLCHGDPELAKRHNIPVANAYQLYMDSIHGRALTRSGLLVAANCSSCHGSHDIRQRSDPESKVNRANVPSTCGTCHAGIAEAYFEGVHGRAFKDGNPIVPECADCHSAHAIARVDTDPWKLKILSECGNCHRQSLRTYRDTLHGQVTALGFTPTARCSDCHGSHRVFPASDPKSSISPVNLVATCQKCHPRANENFVLFSPHADPHDREKNPSLYYAAQMMHYLLIGVFAFFGMHTGLWLLRSLFESREPEEPRRTPSDDAAESEEE